MSITRYFTKDQHKNLWLALWLVLGIFQAAFTELMDDEAYYWVYSRHMDWGYFDHPPMVALLIKAGYALFHNELGVRIGVVILNTLTLQLTWLMLPRKDNRIFFIILAAMGAMQIGGMLAVPDVPLIFFAALYFLLYRNFLDIPSWRNTMLLGVGMALMFYSKYHGILLVFFTVLANLRLLRSFKFYVACILTTVLFFPHLYWQYTHGFPSLQYHLVERNASSYDITYSLDYLVGQILLFGPLMGWLLLYYAFICPIESRFERTLKFSVIGVLVFFLISTFKGRVEANWTVMVFTPTVILAHQAILRKGYALKWLQYGAYVTLAVVLVARVYLVWDFMPGVEVRPELHHNKAWAAAMSKRAGNTPVVFLNSYQWPSKYAFYAHQESYSINSRFARRSQYNYWDTEKALWGKPVMIAFQGDDELPITDSIATVKGKWYYHLEPHFYAYSLVQLEPAIKEIKGRKGERVPVVFRLRNGYGQPLPVDTTQEAVIGYAMMHQHESLPPVKSDLTLSRAIKRRIVSLEIVLPDEVGTYQLKACIFSGVLPPTHNSPMIKVKVED